MKFADKKREWLVDVVPVFRLPDVRSGFPAYDAKLYREVLLTLGSFFSF